MHKGFVKFFRLKILQILCYWTAMYAEVYNLWARIFHHINKVQHECVAEVADQEEEINARNQEGRWTARNKLHKGIRNCDNFRIQRMCNINWKYRTLNYRKTLNCKHQAAILHIYVNAHFYVSSVKLILYRIKFCYPFLYTYLLIIKSHSKHPRRTYIKYMVLKQTY